MNESRSHLAVFGMVLTVIVVTFLTGYFNAPKLGLDLQGGLEVVLEAKPRADQGEVTTEDITQSLEIIRSRVDQLGVAEPEIRPQGDRQIAIALPGVGDPAQAAEVIGSTAQLRFYDLQENVVDGQLFRSDFDALKANQDLLEENDPIEFYLFDEDSGARLAGPEQSEEDLFEEFDGREPEGSVVLKVPEGYVLLRSTRPDGLSFALQTEPQEGVGRFDAEQGIFLLMRDEPGLDGTAIELANPEAGGQFAGQTGSWATAIRFNRAGGRAFEDITRELAQRGRLRQNNQNFAIVLDDEIVSAPYIDYQDNPSGISGGNAQITGLQSREEASNLALVLNTGSLPVKFEIVSRTQVSATLGAQSLQQGLYAGAAGLLVVILYMLVFYRFLGVVAAISLSVFAFALYGLIVAIPIVLTLPGIAGVILTIGIAADANIVIFERIREEFRNGRPVVSAIRNGFRRGISTIIDANIVTLITAGVLFLLGTSGVRGFALLLFVGILLSMFVAIGTTYAVLGLLSRARFFQQPWAIGAKRRPLRFTINWMRYRRVFFGMSVAIVIATVAGLLVQGLNLGIDFRGGTKVQVALSSDADTAEVRDTLSALQPSYATANIQETVPTAGTEAIGTSAFSIQVDQLVPDIDRAAPRDLPPDDAIDTERENLLQALAQQQLIDALDEAFGVVESNVQTIGPTFGRQILIAAVLAIAVSLLLEVGYIWARFEWKFAIPVIIALAHDLLIAIGLYAWSGREFKASTVAALLTVLGYSLYDTIIVFDRIRENARLLRKSSWGHITSRSLNEVLTRSINTSISTMLPILAIFLFGGETLTDFAFALMVGIFAGAYSSLFVAAPVLSLLKEREARWAKRASREKEEQEMADYRAAMQRRLGGEDPAIEEAGTAS